MDLLEGTGNDMTLPGKRSTVRWAYVKWWAGGVSRLLQGSLLLSLG